VTHLDPDELLKRALTEASQLIRARWGVILLCNRAGELSIAASIDPANQQSETRLGKPGLATTEAYKLVEEAARRGKAEIINDFAIEGQRTPLLIAPILISDRQLGAILLADKPGGEIFAADDQELLSTLAWQTAVVLESVYLCDDVRQQRDELARMKRHGDNIFASITSGVITTDPQDIITTFNRAAERILQVSAEQALHRPYHQVLGFLLATSLPDLIEDVHQHNRLYVDQEICCHLPQGERVYLNVNISPLQGDEGEYVGVAIALDDITDKHRYERERALVRRYLPAGLVDRLPHSLAELDLREERRILTVLFVDIRGFTGFSEVNPPERVMEVINHYMTLAEAAVRFNRGIVDKYIGDAVMALFNTPLLDEPDHAWRAVQMAWTLKEAVDAYHRYIPTEEQLSVGFGICTGVVVVGNMGAEGRMEYTAVGDTVNIARRLQENAQPGQILISHETWEMVRDRAQVNPLPTMRVRGRRTFTRVYELVDVGDVD
jgi:adenylate cyclase